MAAAVAWFLVSLDSPLKTTQSNQIEEPNSMENIHKSLSGKVVPQSPKHAQARTSHQWL